MEFKFIQEYHEKINEFKKHSESIESSLISKENEHAILAENYEKFIGEGKLKEATDFKKAMKELEIEIEAEKDILNNLKQRIIKGDPDAADKAIRKYIEFLNEQEEFKNKIIEKAEKRKLEYLKSVKEITEFNGKLRWANHYIQNIVSHIGGGRSILSPNDIKQYEFYIQSNDFQKA